MTPGPEHQIGAEQVKQELEAELMIEMKKRFVNRVITPELRAEILKMVDEKLAEYNEMLDDVQETKGPKGLGLNNE